ncbi:hypothetical protein OGAPHI_006661 [Ogataea philodendri]|uniref:Uncharacterized protein n=1 Tax=Ogataea philodendri TaxID=1378263 RepID=A0A9P8NXI6_9ASCO|nr:uncharacterized protein OGAPHI_006661 [Ogataea philodendri]KAH3661254.1 hypothetical protein OGAPHI_006661 [Ogataea philodendri]
MLSTAPFFWITSDAAAVANWTAVTRSAPKYSCETTPPKNVSPAPVVSTTFSTLTPETCSTVSSFCRMQPRPPRVIMTVVLGNNLCREASRSLSSELSLLTICWASPSLTTRMSTFCNISTSNRSALTGDGL